MSNEKYSIASEILYKGKAAKGQDYNKPASFPLFFQHVLHHELSGGGAGGL